MKKLTKIYAVISAIIFAFPLFGCGQNGAGAGNGVSCGCASSPRGEATDFYAMNTAIHAEVADKPFAGGEEEKLRELFSSLEKEFSASEKDSFVSALNGAAAGEETEISERGKELLRLSERVFAVTGGAFDPTVLPLSELWGFYPSFPVANFIPPTNEQISEVLNSGNIGLGNIILSESGQTVSKKTGGTKIEFGGVLKGYAADEAGKIFLSNGHESGYVNAGGSSLFILSSTSLGVRHPRKSGENLLTVDIEGRKNFSVSTSGDYEKVYSYEGQSFCHVIDPETGKPVSTGVAQVTIIGGNGNFCGAFIDAATTALMTKDFSSEAGAKSPLVAMINELLSAPELEGAIIFVAAITGENGENEENEENEEKTLITNAESGAYALLDKSFSVFKI